MAIILQKLAYLRRQYTDKGNSSVSTMWYSGSDAKNNDRWPRQPPRHMQCESPYGISTADDRMSNRNATDGIPLTRLNKSRPFFDTSSSLFLKAILQPTVNVGLCLRPVRVPWKLRSLIGPLNWGPGNIIWRKELLDLRMLPYVNNTRMQLLTYWSFQQAVRLRATLDRSMKSLQNHR